MAFNIRPKGNQEKKEPLEKKEEQEVDQEKSKGESKQKSAKSNASVGKKIKKTAKKATLKKDKPVNVSKTKASPESTKSVIKKQLVSKKLDSTQTKTQVKSSVIKDKDNQAQEKTNPKSKIIQESRGKYSDEARVAASKIRNTLENRAAKGGKTTAVAMSQGKMKQQKQSQQASR